MGLALALVLTLSVPPSAHAISGAGTEANPYVIRTAEDLAAVHDDLDGHYVLGCDLDLTGYRHVPIGNETEGAFTGSFDGQGFTISNLTLDKDGYKYAALFGYLEGSVKNVVLDNCIISGSRYLGGVVAYVSDTACVADCNVLSGNIWCSSSLHSVRAGGVVGECNGNLSGKFSNGANVTLYKGNGGGIVGYTTISLTLTDCKNTGRISSVYSGGIIGSAGGETCEIVLGNCSNTGLINGSYAGGISFGILVPFRVCCVGIP